MAIKDFLDNFFDDGTAMLKTVSAGNDARRYYMNLIVESSVNMIGKTISRCDFQTFDEGREVREKNFYMLNVEANKNSSASRFWREVIIKLLKDGEALILIEDGSLYLANSFERKENVFDENQYSNIMLGINGDHEIKGIKRESEVLYLKDEATNVKTALNSINKDYSGLIDSSIKGFQNSKARKGTLDIPTNLPKTLQEEGALQSHIQNTMADFMDPTKDAVYPQSDGFEYKEVDQTKGSKSNDSGRETKNFIGDMFDFVAIAYGIPPSLLKGDTVDTKDALNNYLTFCINPLAKIITDEVNRKMYGYNLYKEKTYAKMDTSNIKTLDLSDLAGSVDILNRNGALTLDDIMLLLDKEPIGGQEGNTRFVTKNLETLERTLAGEPVGVEDDLKGGE